LLSFVAEAFVLQFAIQKYKDSDMCNCNFPFVLYGCENWSLTLRKEHMLRVFENRVLRRIFGAKRGDVTENWRRLYMEEFYDLY